MHGMMLRLSSAHIQMSDGAARNEASQAHMYPNDPYPIYLSKYGGSSTMHIDTTIDVLGGSMSAPFCPQRVRRRSREDLRPSV